MLESARTMANARRDGKGGRVILKEESPYRLIGEKLFEKFSEQDYADLYSPEGKPAILPVILVFVTVFQFMERLPDRQAAESLRMRMDWKYALRLPLEYEGFDYSVMSEFRDRLLEHEAEGRVFEQLVSEFRAMGLIKECGRQRTDSIAMLMSVRRRSRLELAVALCDYNGETAPLDNLVSRAEEKTVC
ncbi:MAG: transposase [Anaerolineales bacterium]|nr:transposase [Anaerolineales bacterium]